MSYQNAQLVFKGNGLTLIEGENHDEGDSNGSGKSGVWDGVSWALFGQTVRGLTGDEVVNRRTTGTCIAEIQLEYKGSQYSIARSRKPNKLIALKNGAEVQLGTLKMTQEWVEKEFGIDFELFRCTVMFAQEETFNFINESNKRQKEILSKVMRLDFELPLKLAKKEYSEKENSISDHENKINVLKSHQYDPEEQYAEDIANWNDDIKSTISRYSQTLKESKTELKGLEIKDISGLEAIQSKLITTLDSIDTQKESLIKKGAVLDTDIRNWKREIDRMNDLRSKGKCPTCFSLVSELSFDDEVSDLGAKVELGVATSSKIKLKAKSLAENYQSILDKKIKVNTMIGDQKALHEKKRSIENRIKDLTDAIEEQKSAKNPFYGKIQEEKEKQKKIVIKLEELSKEIEDVKSDLVYYEFWINAFGDAGIKSFIFDLVCSSLTEKANYYVGILTNSQVSIRFDTQTKLKSGEFREKFDVSVITAGEVVRYAAYSGGEKRKISLAVDMALSEIMSDYYGSSFNVVLFDEQTNYMDRQGRLAFMNLLKEIGKKKRVFVVDHDAEFKAMFDDVKKIVKKDGISKLQ